MNGHGRSHDHRHGIRRDCHLRRPTAGRRPILPNVSASPLCANVMADMLVLSLRTLYLNRD
jgi:hypothetical protein